MSGGMGTPDYPDPDRHAASLFLQPYSPPSFPTETIATILRKYKSIVGGGPSWVALGPQKLLLLSQLRGGSAVVVSAATTAAALVVRRQTRCTLLLYIAHSSPRVVRILPCITVFLCAVCPPYAFLWGKCGSCLFINFSSSFLFRNSSRFFLIVSIGEQNQYIVGVGLVWGDGAANNILRFNSSKETIKGSYNRLMFLFTRKQSWSWAPIEKFVKFIYSTRNNIFLLKLYNHTHFQWH